MTVFSIIWWSCVNLVFLSIPVLYGPSPEPDEPKLEISHDYDDDHVVASSSSDTSPRYEGDETSSPILDDSSIRNRNKYSRHCGGTYQSTGSTTAAVDKGELLAAALWCQCTDFNNFNLIWDYFCSWKYLKNVIPCCHCRKASVKGLYVTLIIGRHKYVYYHLHWCCLAGIPFGLSKPGLTTYGGSETGYKTFSQRSQYNYQGFNNRELDTSSRTVRGMNVPRAAPSDVKIQISDDTFKPGRSLWKGTSSTHTRGICYLYSTL